MARSEPPVTLPLANPVDRWLTRHLETSVAELQMISCHSSRVVWAIYQHIASDRELGNKYQEVSKGAGLEASLLGKAH
jgi:hypothetical protein